MNIEFTSIPQGILTVYSRIGVVGATDGNLLAGKKTHAESLMNIAGYWFTVYWNNLPYPEFVSEFMWRLA